MVAGPKPELLVVDPRDRDLEVLLGECGARTSRLSVAELAGLAHPAAREPDMIVVDVRGGQAIPPVLSTVKRAHPGVAVLVVGSGSDPATLLDAMRAGAGEFVSEPLTKAGLERALNQLLAHRVETASGQVLAFLGAKGGVGTTTVAVNVATALARRGRTLLIDLHLAHGDAAVFLGAEPRFTVIDALENTHRFDEAFFHGLVTPTKAGPDLLASSDRTPAHDTGAKQFRVVVGFAARLYQYVVLDAPRSDAAALDALDGSASVVIVANQELVTVRSAGRLAAALRLRFGKERVQVVISRFDRHAEITTADVERVVGARVRRLVPSDYRLALQALNLGRPLALENHNKLAAAYRELADDLAGVPAPRPADVTSIFGLLTGRG